MQGPVPASWRVLSAVFLWLALYAGRADAQLPSVNWQVTGSVTADNFTQPFDQQGTVPLGGGSVTVQGSLGTVFVTISPTTVSFSATGRVTLSGVTCDGTGGATGAISAAPSGHLAASGPISGTVHCVFGGGSTMDFPVTGSFSADGVIQSATISAQNIATAASISGNVQVTSQGQALTVAPGILLFQGMTIAAPAGAALQAACPDGSKFTVGAAPGGPASSVFLDSFICPTAGAPAGTASLSTGIFQWASATPASAHEPTLGTNVGTLAIHGANLSLTYNQSPPTSGTSAAQAGPTGAMTAVVQTGTAVATDAATGTATALTAGQQLTISEPVPPLAAAVLPSSRSVQVGANASAFATIINAGTTPAAACAPALLSNIPATFSYQTTDSATNALTGDPATPVMIPPGAPQSYVFSLTPTAPIAPTDVQLGFACGVDQAPITLGVDTLLLSASATAVPDIIALAVTPTNNGIVVIPGPAGINAFAVATVNVGVSGPITASADTGAATLALTLLVCQTDPGTGGCLAPPAPSVQTQINSHATPTFAVFVTGKGTVPFDPANNRIFVRFKDAGGVTRGSTSVAVETQ